MLNGLGFGKSDDGLAWLFGAFLLLGDLVSLLAASAAGSENDISSTARVTTSPSRFIFSTTVIAPFIGDDPWPKALL